MPNQLSDARARRAATKREVSVPDDGGGVSTREYPVREFIGARALELAQMARWVGETGLAALLDAVADRAGQSNPDAARAVSVPRPA